MEGTMEDALTPKATTLLAVIVVASLTGIAGLAADASPLQGHESDPLSGALNAMYNVEYERAQSILQPWLEAHPTDFRAWNYLAETLLDKEMLREGLFSGAAYRNAGAVFRKRREPLPKGFEDNLNRMLGKAQSLETDRLKKNPNDEDALYWLGVTYNIRTELDFTLLRSYFAALEEGKQAWKINLRLLKLNPHNIDAYFDIGLADYAVGSLPWYVKIVTSVAGIHGNRKRGIAELKRASQEGRYTRVDAKIVLIAIYERQKSYSQALALLDELQQDFPENFLLPVEIANVYEAQNNWRAASEVYDSAVEKFVHGKQTSPRIPAATVLYNAGQAHEHLGELQEALHFYEEAGKLPGNSMDIYRADLAAANLNRRLNRPEAARKEYQRVAEAAPNTPMGKTARQALEKFQ